jgi:hypothetical protein
VLWKYRTLVNFQGKEQGTRQEVRSIERRTDSRTMQHVPGTGRPDFRKPYIMIKGPKESRNHAGKIRGTRTHVRGNKRFKEDGRSRDRRDRFQEPESMIKEPDNSRERRYRFPEPDVMFKGTKDFTGTSISIRHNQSLK